MIYMNVNLYYTGLQLDPQEAQIAALKRELFLLRQENVWLRDQVCNHVCTLADWRLHVILAGMHVDIQTVDIFSLKWVEIQVHYASCCNCCHMLFECYATVPAANWQSANWLEVPHCIVNISSSLSTHVPTIREACCHDWRCARPCWLAEAQSPLFFCHLSFSISLSHLLGLIFSFFTFSVSPSSSISFFFLQIMPGAQLPSGMVTPLHGRTTSASRPLSSQSDTTGSTTRCLHDISLCLLPCPG